MRQLTCEMCGGTDLVKENGVFVCQTCGCKYSVEEARKMMFDGGEYTPAEVKVPVKPDNSEQIKHYLELSRTAYAGGNGESASSYADKALEMDPQNADAWIAKMKAIEYMATLGNLRLMEVYELGKKAISCAKTQDEKEKISAMVCRYQLQRALDLLKLATSKMQDTAEIQNTYRKFAAISIMSASEHTSDLDKTTVSIYDKVASEAINFVLLIPDAVLEANLPLCRLAEECRKQYQFETNALAARYRIYGMSLTYAASASRTAQGNKISDKVERAKKRAAAKETRERQERIKRENAEKQEKIERYWAEHAEEKVALEEEKDTLEAKVAELKKEVDMYNKKRTTEADALRKERDKKIPAEIEYDEFKRSIRDMEMERDRCGIFKAKEKKELQSKIDGAYFELQRKQKEMQTAKEQHVAQYNAKIREANKIGKEVIDEYSRLHARISEINAKLSGADIE